jgi:dsRNA-specific ribonuclease
MANAMIAGRSYANWVREICQRNKYPPPEVNVPEVPQDNPSAPKQYDCKMKISDGTGAQLFEVTFVAESKQKAKQGAALAMIREMGFTDEMLEVESVQPKPDGELRRSVRKALEAQEAGVELNVAPSAPYVTDLLEESKISYVSELKKLCARTGLIKPEYEDTDATGPAHLRAFKIKVKIGGRGVVEDFVSDAYATGKKQQVKDLAAYRLLQVVAPMEDAIRLKMLQWAEESEENKSKFAEEFLLPPPAMENLNINE